MGNSETMPTLAMDAMTLCNWKVSVGKAMFVIKTMVKEEVLKHMRKMMTLNKA